jgi:hypothetical protein
MENSAGRVRYRPPPGRCRWGEISPGPGRGSSLCVLALSPFRFGGSTNSIVIRPTANDALLTLPTPNSCVAKGSPPRAMPLRGQVITHKLSCEIEPSLQRVRRTLSCGAYKSSYVIHGRRIGTSSLRKGVFLHASPM